MPGAVTTRPDIAHMTVHRCKKKRKKKKNAIANYKLQYNQQIRSQHDAEGRLIRRSGVHLVQRVWEQLVGPPRPQQRQLSELPNRPLQLLVLLLWSGACSACVQQDARRGSWDDGHAGARWWEGSAGCYPKALQGSQLCAPPIVASTQHTPAPTCTRCRQLGQRARGCACINPEALQDGIRAGATVGPLGEALPSGWPAVHRSSAAGAVRCREAQAPACLHHRDCTKRQMHSSGSGRP